MQKYRADTSRTQEDGSTLWFANWMGGQTLAKIDNCRLHMAGEMRRTVYTTGEPDTFFSQPAICKIAGCRVKGYVAIDDDDNTLYFRPVFYS
jgi:hypothetical protein